MRRVGSTSFDVGPTRKKQAPFCDRSTNPGRPPCGALGLPALTQSLPDKNRCRSATGAQILENPRAARWAYQLRRWVYQLWRWAYQKKQAPFCDRSTNPGRRPCGALGLPALTLGLPALTLGLPEKKQAPFCDGSTTNPGRPPCGALGLPALTLGLPALTGSATHKTVRRSRTRVAIPGRPACATAKLPEHVVSMWLIALRS